MAGKESKPLVVIGWPRCPQPLWEQERWVSLALHGQRSRWTEALPCLSESEAGALSSCEWPSHGGGFSCCGARALGMRASVVMVHQACCSEAVDSFQTRDRTHVLYIGRWILITVPLEKCLTFSNNISTFFNLMRKHTYHNKHKFIALGRRQLN